jgi:hypothetical protein
MYTIAPQLPRPGLLQLSRLAAVRIGLLLSNTANLATSDIL